MNVINSASLYYTVVVNYKTGRPSVERYCHHVYHLIIE